MDDCVRRRVEGVVSEALGVRLEAADLSLRPPSAEQLHSDVGALIAKGVEGGGGGGAAGEGQGTRVGSSAPSTSGVSRQLHG
jgi:hypothetical protein